MSKTALLALIIASLAAPPTTARQLKQPVVSGAANDTMISASKAVLDMVTLLT